MPTAVIYRCVQCKKLLDIQDAYYDIGTPFLRCSKCGTFNVISRTKNEWDLKSRNEQYGTYAKVVFVGAFLGLGVGALLGEGIRWLLSSQSTKLALYFMPVGVPLGIWFFWSILQSQIAESRERMADGQYVAILAKLGLSVQKR